MPLEPTEKMIEAARAECFRMQGVIDPVMHIWDVMLAAAPQSGWLPIETAPYATRVLGWLYLPRNPIASAPVIAERCYVEKDDPESYGNVRQTVECWWANDRYYHAGTDTGYITGWQPLPPAPSSPPSKAEGET